MSSFSFLPTGASVGARLAREARDQTHCFGGLTGLFAGKPRSNRFGIPSIVKFYFRIWGDIR
jgi:hypothetical protein